MPSASAAYVAKRNEAKSEAELAFDGAVNRYKAGQGTLEDAIQWSERARAFYSPTSNVEHRERMRQLERDVASRVASGAGTSYDLHVIAYYRASAESNAP
jgi:hypothetical protein